MSEYDDPYMRTKCVACWQTGVASCNHQGTALTLEKYKTTLVSGQATGVKDDNGKLDWTLLPWSSLTVVVKVLEVGAKKYDRDNWQQVPDAKIRYSKALLRHVLAYVGGETYDEETGLHHLAHATCCTLFLLWFDK